MIHSQDFPTGSVALADNYKVSSCRVLLVSGKVMRIYMLSHETSLTLCADTVIFF